MTDRAVALPKSLATMPAVRAASLSVKEVKHGQQYNVQGSSGWWLVWIINGVPVCGCQAGRNRIRCAHVIAAVNFYIRREREEQSKMPKPEFKSQSDNEKRQVPLVSVGIFGALMSFYTPTYEKEYKGKKTPVTSVGFVILWDSDGNPIMPTQARAQLTNSLYVDTKTPAKTARQVEFLVAILAGSKTPLTAAEISADNGAKVPDYDTLIGRPISLFIEPSTVAAANSGLFYNNIRRYIAPDKALLNAARELYKAKGVDVGIDERSGYKILTKPVPSYIEKMTAGSSSSSFMEDETAQIEDIKNEFFGSSADEIPF
jgi:hypothetical protein